MLPQLPISQVDTDQDKEVPLLQAKTRTEMTSPRLQRRGNTNRPPKGYGGLEDLLDGKQWTWERGVFKKRCLDAEAYN